MARLTTRFWVDAYLARLRLNDIPVFVVRHGDDTAGAVLVKLSTLRLGRRGCFDQRSFDHCRAAHASGQNCLAKSAPKARWMRPSPASDDFDPDLWVIEVEDRAGRHLLDEDRAGLMEWRAAGIL